MWKNNGDGTISMYKTRRLMRKCVQLVRLAYDDKIDEMQKFINEHEEDCWKMQMVNVDVLVYALLRKQFKSYALLQSRGFKLDAGSDAKTRKSKKLTDDELEKLRSEIRQRFISSDIYLELESGMSNLVQKLLLKTKLACDKRYMTFFHIIRQSYDELEAMEAVRPILVIIADSEPLEIVCDFIELHVGFMHPGAPFVTGLCDFREQIILLSSGFEKEVAVHEFIHYIMQVLYKNRSLPFSSTDTYREEAYSKAYVGCEALYSLEICSEFKHSQLFGKNENYPPEEIEYIRKTEAITFPAMIPLQFRAETVMKYEQDLMLLFDFYKKFTLPEIVRRSQEIEARWEVK